MSRSERYKGVMIWYSLVDIEASQYDHGEWGETRGVRHGEWDHSVLLAVSRVRVGGRGLSDLPGLLTSGYTSNIPTLTSGSHTNYRNNINNTNSNYHNNYININNISESQD